jgi:hypothetical protein
MTATRNILWAIVITKVAVLALFIVWLALGGFKLARLAMVCVLTGLGIYFLVTRLQRQRSSNA